MFYRLLSRAMGLRVNGEAFEKLTSILPLKLLHKNRENIVQLEALFFGQAGFLLAEPQDAYTQSMPPSQPKRNRPSPKPLEAEAVSGTAGKH